MIFLTGLSVVLLLPSCIKSSIINWDLAVVDEELVLLNHGGRILRGAAGLRVVVVGISVVVVVDVVVAVVVVVVPAVVVDIVTSVSSGALIPKIDSTGFGKSAERRSQILLDVKVSGNFVVEKSFDCKVAKAVVEDLSELAVVVEVVVVSGAAVVTGEVGLESVVVVEGVVVDTDIDVISVVSGGSVVVVEVVVVEVVVVEIVSGVAVVRRFGNLIVELCFPGVALSLVLVGVFEVVADEFALFSVVWKS